MPTDVSKTPDISNGPQKIETSGACTRFRGFCISFILDPFYNDQPELTYPFIFRMSAARRNPPLYYNDRIFPQDDIRVHGDLDYMPGGISLVGHGKFP